MLDPTEDTDEESSAYIQPYRHKDYPSNRISFKLIKNFGFMKNIKSGKLVKPQKVLYNGKGHEINKSFPS